MTVTLTEHEGDLRLLFTPFLFAKGFLQRFNGKTVFFGSVVFHGLLRGLVDLFFFGFWLFRDLLFLGHQSL